MASKRQRQEKPKPVVLKLDPEVAKGAGALMAVKNWHGAGGPAYYAVNEQGRVVAILYWTDTDVSAEANGDPVVIDAGWSVVLTKNGDVIELDDGLSLAGLGDEEQVEAINATVEAAAQLIEEEGF